MPLRIPLYGKVLGWFLLNVALVAAVAAFFITIQLGGGLEWLLTGRATEQLAALGETVSAELAGRPVPEWSPALPRFQPAEGADFFIFRNDGIQSAGAPVELPAAVAAKLRDGRRPPALPPPPRREEGRPPPPDGVGPPGAPPRPRLAFFLRAGSPSRYWAGIHLSLPYREKGEMRATTLLIAADSLAGGGLFFELRPWLGFGIVALLVSATGWLPMAGGITRAIRRTNAAAQQIAQGHFEVRLPENRRDELGDLASSVNAMAAQLAEYVDRQRRLTADVAHELCSPIARMQRALGIVEQRASPEQQAYLDSLDRELQHMARLVEEVLSFSRMEKLPERAEFETFSLAELLGEVVTREALDATIGIELPRGLKLHAIREAVDRALSNILRNAVRYAGQAGPIDVTATERRDGVVISVRDYGPGVPAGALEMIFEPFYRPEMARQRTTGGSGLGLAIVKRCVTACGGTVLARAAEPGLEIVMMLPAPRVEQSPALTGGATPLLLKAPASPGQLRA